MSFAHVLPDRPKQLLSREAYISEAWLALEREHLFNKAWTFAGAVNALAHPGDYLTLTVGTSPLIVLRTGQGELRAYHNLCRHRGTELLEGCGQLKSTIVCPYHRWTFDLEGRLRGVPNQQDCFPDIDKAELGLLPASLGVFKGLVFVHPDAEPDLSFDKWLGGLANAAWPYDVSDAKLHPGDEIVYEMQCNWKVFYENAIDGYHLAYLHENTLGSLFPDANVWVAHGQNLIWYSTEREGEKRALPTLVESMLGDLWARKIDNQDEGRYGGVYMLFPSTIVTPSAYGVTVSQLVPVSAGVTLLKARTWAPAGSLGRYGRARDMEGYDKARGVISSAQWKKHPLESGDFQMEDVWICEKMQRSLMSPAYRVGALARGAGAEAPIEHFQRCLLDYLPAEARPADVF